MDEQPIAGITFMNSDFCREYREWSDWNKSNDLKIPRALLYLGILKLFVIKGFRNQSAWPMTFAMWLEYNLVMSTMDVESLDDEDYAKPQRLTDYSHEKWLAFLEKWNSNVRRFTAGKVTEKMVKHYLKADIDCKLLNFEGIERLLQIDALILLRETTYAELASMLQEMYGGEARPSAPPVEQEGEEEAFRSGASAYGSGAYAAGEVYPMEVYPSAPPVPSLRNENEIADITRAIKMRPVPTPSRHGDLLGYPNVITQWKSLGTQVMDRLSLSIPEEVDDRQLIQHWKKYATALSIMLKRVQELVDKMFFETFEQNPPPDPYPDLHLYRVDDDSQARNKENFAEQRVIFERERAQSTPRQRQWITFINQLRRPEHWQEMYKEVLRNVGALTEDVVRGMPPVRDYLSEICKLLCQARLQEPLLHVRVDHGVYIKYGPLEGDADMAAWNALTPNAPVREGNVRKAKRTFVISVWPGLVEEGDLRRESLDGLPEIKGGEQFAVVALEDEMPV